MKRVLVAVIAIACGPSLVRAQSSAIHLTLDEAITRGLEASHRLAELLAREEASRAVTDQRESATKPQLSFFGSYTRMSHVEEFRVPNPAGGAFALFPDIPNTFRTRVDLQWPIYTAGRLASLVRAAGDEAGASAQDREAARADVKLEITRAYWAVVTAKASQVVVNQALERTQSHLADVRQQLGVGLVPPSDVSTVEAQQAREQLLRIEADNLVETSSAEFRKLVGLEPDAPFELVDALPTNDPRYRPGLATPTESLTAPAVTVGVTTARSARPERKALEFRVDAAAERVTAASAGSKPVVSAVGGYDFSRPNMRIFPIQADWKPTWDLGVNLRLPLFDGGRTRAETAEAVANRRAAEARLREFDAALEVEVRQRTADLRSAQASIEAAQAGLLAAAEARRVLGDRFTAGVATNTEVIDAQTSLLQAELALTRAIANTHLAAARLERALGK
jgi:outer membrane protein TolC